MGSEMCIRDRVSNIDLTRTLFSTMKLASPRKQKQYISIEADDDEEPRKYPTRRSSSRVSFSDVAEEKKVEHAHDYSTTPTPALRKVPRRSSKAIGKGKGVTENNDGKGSDSNRKSLLRRLTNPFERKSSKNSIDQESSEHEDPVMTIFASRNTQRVRFSLEGAESDSKRNKSQELASNVKQFMSRALFGGSTKSSKNLKEEMEREVAELGGSLIWESAETSTGPEVVQTQSDNKDNGLTIAFTEDPKIRAKHAKLLRKAERAEEVQFRYEYALNPVSYTHLTLPTTPYV